MTMRPGLFASFFSGDTLKLSVLLMIFSVILFTPPDTSAQSTGIFDNNSDVGLATHAGAAQFIQSSNEYRITGGGANIWGQKDAFQFLWKKDSGDFSLTTRMRWIVDGKYNHRKAGWMIRESLTADSPYADAIIHGDGLTCLQFRKTKGEPTDEIRSPISAPAFLRLERHGWSPDSKTLAYCAERNGNYDIYTIAVEGGRETRLTSTEGLDDGPDYSPDGRYIYFNSERTGAMKIWRMFTYYAFFWKGPQGPDPLVRRTGHDKRPILVAGQQIYCVRQLSPGRQRQRQLI